MESSVSCIFLTRFDCFPDSHNIYGLHVLKQMREELTKKQRFRSWAEQYTEDVYRYFYCNLRLTAEESEELTQRTFVTAWESIERFEERSSPKTWLLGIARMMRLKFFTQRQVLSL